MADTLTALKTKKKENPSRGGPQPKGARQTKSKIKRPIV